jgi:hypothetical protein
MNNLAEKIEGETVAVFDLPGCLQNSDGRASKAKLSLQQVEVEHIRNVLQNCGGNKTKAAQVLGIDRKTLRDKLERHVIINKDAYLKLHHKQALLWPLLGSRQCWPRRCNCIAQSRMHRQHRGRIHGCFS